MKGKVSTPMVYHTYTMPTTQFTGPNQCGPKKNHERHSLVIYLALLGQTRKCNFSLGGDLTLEVSAEMPQSPASQPPAGRPGHPSFSCQEVTDTVSYQVPRLQDLMSAHWVPGAPPVVYAPPWEDRASQSTEHFTKSDTLPGAHPEVGTRKPGRIH